jgi:ribosomal-protein-alanine N-acetyltransferase
MFYFRSITPSDLDQIMKIEQVSFSSPWSQRFFLQEIQASCAHSRLALLGEEIVGYVIYWLLPDEADIHNLAVHPAYRRRGLGRALMQAVIEEAKSRRSTRVTLEVRKSNEAAQQLYQGLGFETRGVRKAYYSDNGEDALVMVLEVDGSRSALDCVKQVGVGWKGFEKA